MLDQDFTNMTISNMYETDEYANFAQLMYDWAQAGFISKDAATSTEDRNTLLQGRQLFGILRLEHSRR